jgi:hypothetical protein
VDANSLLILPALFGDANLDNTVDAFDLNCLAAHWQSPAPDLLWSDGDFTGDGKVDAFDLNILASKWQHATGDSTTILHPFAAIPEPTSLSMLAIATLPLLTRPRIRSIKWGDLH